MSLQLIQARVHALPTAHTPRCNPCSPRLPRACVPRPRPDETLAAAVLERFAMAGSGKCNVLTMLAGVVAVSALDVGPAHESTLAKANVMFDVFDLDSDGQISEVELVRPGYIWGRPFAPAETALPPAPRITDLTP